MNSGPTENHSYNEILKKWTRAALIYDVVKLSRVTKVTRLLVTGATFDPRPTNLEVSDDASQRRGLSRNTRRDPKGDEG